MKITLNQANKKSKYSKSGDTYTSQSKLKSIKANNDADVLIEGIYFNEAISKNLRISSRDSGLEVELFGVGSLELEYLDQRLYGTDNWYLNRLSFEEDEMGEITSCKVFNTRNRDFVLFEKR